ncbi:hypothetical protein IBZ15_10010 [Serratia marcescens]|uniref:hypothetical protein n=1 Tax=Serratia marcescens TaxID=615 RepID=UPI0039B43B18
MSSKQISYKVTGRDNEQYIFLDRLEDGTYQVREGTSTPVSHMEWEESFSTYSLEEFLAGHPQHRSKVEELIAEFEAE